MQHSGTQNRDTTAANAAFNNRSTDSHQNEPLSGVLPYPAEDTDVFAIPSLGFSPIFDSTNSNDNNTITDNSDYPEVMNGGIYVPTTSLEVISPTSCPPAYPFPDMRHESSAGTPTQEYSRLPSIPYPAGSPTSASNSAPDSSPIPSVYPSLAPTGSASSVNTATPSSPISCTPGSHNRAESNVSYASISNPQDGFGIANYDPWKHTQSPGLIGNEYSPNDNNINNSISNNNHNNTSSSNVPLTSHTLIQHHLSISSSETGSSSTRSSSVRSNVSTNTTNSSYFSGVNSTTNLGVNQLHHANSYSSATYHYQSQQPNTQQLQHNNSTGAKSASEFNVSSVSGSTKGWRGPPKPHSNFSVNNNKDDDDDESSGDFVTGLVDDLPSNSHVFNPLQSPFTPNPITTNTNSGNRQMNSYLLNTNLRATSTLPNHLQRTPSAQDPPTTANRNSFIADMATVRPRKANSQLNPQTRRLLTNPNSRVPSTHGPSSRPASFALSNSAAGVQEDSGLVSSSSDSRHSSVSSSCDPLVGWSSPANQTSSPDLIKKRQASSTSTLSRTTTASNLNPASLSSSVSIPTVGKANSGEWHVFWDISVDQLESGMYNKYDVNFQSELHSFIQSEVNFVHGMKAFLTVFNNRQELSRILEPKQLEDLDKLLFDPTEKLIQANETHLLNPFLQEREKHLAISPRTKQTPMLEFLADSVLEWLTLIVDPFFQWAKSQSEADSLVSMLLQQNQEFASFVSQGNTQSVKECQKTFDYLKNFPRNRFPQYILHFSELQKFLTKKQKQIAEDGSLPPQERDPTLLAATDPEPLIQSFQACIDALRKILKKFNDVIAFEMNKTKMEELERKLRFKHEEHKMSIHLRYNPKEPHLLHELVAEKDIYRKKGSWESNFSVLLLDHMLFLVRKERDYWQVVERPIHLELLRIEAVPDPEYKNAIYNTINRQAPQSTRSSVSNQYSQRPSIATISSQDGISISPTTSTTLPMPPSSKASNKTATSPSPPAKTPLDSPDHLSELDKRLSSPSGSISRNSKPSGIDLPSPSLSASFSSAPTTPVNSGPQAASNTKLSTSNTFPNPSTPSYQTGNSMMKDINNNAQSGLVYPLKLMNLERDEKSWIAFDRLQERQNFMDLLLSTRRKYFNTRHEQRKVPIGLKVLDMGTFPSSEHHIYSYSDVGFGDVVDRAITSYNTQVQRPTNKTFRNAGDTSCALDIVYEGRYLTFLGTANGVYGAIHPTGPDGSPLTGSAYELRWKLVAQLPRVTHLEANIDSNVLLILADSELKFSQLPDIQSLLLSTTATLVTPPQDIYNSVRCFRTGTLEDHTYLFYSKMSKAQEKVFTTTVIVYKIAPSHNKEKRSKGLGRLIKGSSSTKPYSFFLQPPNLIPGELFSPSKVVDFSFFDHYFFFHTANEFSYMSLSLENPVGLPKVSSMGNVLKKHRYPATELPLLKEDLEKARPIAVARLSHMNNSSNSSSSTPAPNPKEEPNLIHCFHKFAIMSIRNGDLYVPAAQTVNGQLCRMPYRIPYLHKVQAVYLLWPYLLLFSPNTIEVRLVTAGNFNQSLVQVIAGRNIRLLTGRSSHAASMAVGKNKSGSDTSQLSRHMSNVSTVSGRSTSSHSSTRNGAAVDAHTGETEKIIVSMEHPDPAVPASIVFEICKNSGVLANDIALKSSLYDLDSKKPRRSGA